MEVARQPEIPQLRWILKERKSKKNFHCWQSNCKLCSKRKCGQLTATRMDEIQNELCVQLVCVSLVAWWDVCGCIHDAIHKFLLREYGTPADQSTSPNASLRPRSGQQIGLV